MDIKITKRQKNIITIISVIAAAFIVFALFVYIPARRELSKLKREYEATESEISQIKKMGGSEKTLEETISKLTARLDVLNDMFPSKEEGILNMLSQTAEKFKIEVVSMSPEKKRIVHEMGGAQVNVKGCAVQEMAVSMTLKANYKEISEFVRTVREDFPVYVKFDEIRMEKAPEEKAEKIEKTDKTPKEGHPLLNITIKVHSYLVCAQTESHG